MQENSQYSQIINSWLEYIALEELSSIKINSSDITKYNLYQIASSSCIFSLNQDNLKITFSHELLSNQEFIESLSQRINQSDSSGNENAQSIDFFVLFPVIETRYKNLENNDKPEKDIYYIPFFVLKISTKINEVLAVDITKHNKNLASQNALAYPFIEINLEKITDYIVCKPFFINALKMSDDEINELPLGKPLLTFLREFLNQESNKNFFELIKVLKKWIGNKINYKQYRITPYDFIFLWNVTWQDINTQKIKNQLKLLSSEEFNPESYQLTAVHEYLYGRQKEKFEQYNTPDDTFWYGTFDNFPLSKGQAMVLQKLAKGENLIACQGPPGTGKTTLLMALVADILTRRALSIAINKKDFPSLILVCSTANKAVWNAARDFASHDKFVFSELHKNGGFYFTGGKKEFITKSIDKIDKVNEWLISQNIEKTKEEIERVKEQLITAFEDYIKTINQIKKLKEDYIKIIYEIGKFYESNPDIDEINFILKTEQKKLKEIFINNYGLKEEQLNSGHLLNEIDKAKEWNNLYKSSDLYKKGITKSNFCYLNNQELKNSIIECYSYFKNMSFFKKIINIFTGESNKIINSFISKYKDVITLTGYNWQQVVKQKIFVDYIEELSTLINQIEKLDLVNVNDIFLQDEVVNLAKNYLSISKELKQIEILIEKRDYLLQKKEEITQNSLYKWVKHGIFEFIRQEYKTTRKLFHLSEKFLSLYAVLNRDEIVRCTNLFKQLKGDNSLWFKAREEIIKNIGIEKFYLYISLIFPIHFSSLHSSSYIFDDFIRPNSPLPQDFLKENFKPIYLTFIDESAMALPQIAYPVVYWSQNVVAVGDPLQIPPVVSIDNRALELYHDEFYSNIDRNRLSPAITTVYHRAAKCNTGNPTDIGQACFIDYHRRCQKPIAELFAKIAGYNNLVIDTPPLNEEDQQKLNKMGGKHLLFYDVHGIHGDKRNTNIAEAISIKHLIKKLLDAGYQSKEIIVITPYKNQEDLLQKALCNENLLPLANIGTIHKFQGSQAKVVIFSSVIFAENDSSSFINSAPNILNVAVSRAEQLFIVVGNYEKLKSSGGNLRKIIDACESQGNVIRHVEFDETEDRKKKYKTMVSDIKKSLKNNITLLKGPIEHMKAFEDFVNNAKNDFIIVTPWVKMHNLQNFSLDYLKKLNEKGIKVKIIYGYSENDYGEDEALALLKEFKNISLNKHPNSTHSKLIITDNSQAIIGSFNWLSHAYYKKNLPDYVLLRDETSVVVNDKNVIDKIINGLNIAQC